MHLYLSDGRFNSIALIIIAVVTIIPAMLSAYWSRKAGKNSVEARDNSIQAKENSAGALHEVKSNGGMLEPDPTLKDKINYLIDLAQKDGRRIDKLDANFELHLKHSRIMDAALAEVFFVVKPDLKRDDLEEIIN